MPERTAPHGRRAPLVAGGVFALGVCAWLLYQHGSPEVADRVIFAYAAVLLVGPGLVYAVLRCDGASSRRSALVALGIPGLWLAKELWRTSAVHPLAETLYYALNPIALGVYSAALVPMALVEVGLRRRCEGVWRPGGWPGAVLAAFALLAAAAAAVGANSGGRQIFYDYVAVYRAIFAGG